MGRKNGSLEGGKISQLQEGPCACYTSVCYQGLSNKACCQPYFLFLLRAVNSLGLSLTGAVGELGKMISL